MKKTPIKKLTLGKVKIASLRPQTQAGIHGGVGSITDTQVCSNHICQMCTRDCDTLFESCPFVCTY